MSTSRFVSGAGGLWVRVLTGPVVAAVLIVVVSGGRLTSSASYSIALAATYGIVVLSVSLLARWSGVWSVGHPALLAVGAYTASWGSMHGWGLELTVLVAVAMAAVLGALIGFAGSRFSILYIALLTLAFDLVVLELVGRFVSVTGGDQGVAVNPLPSRLGLGGITSLTDTLTWPIAVFGLLAAVTVFVRRSVIRMRWVAAKSHPLVARTVGISPEAQVALAFAVSAAVTALAGVLFAELSAFVSPEPFSLGLAINVIAAAVLGGIGSTTGAVLGGAFMAWSGDIASAVGLDAPILQGLVLIVLLLFLPRGVVPSLTRLGALLLRRVRGTDGGGSEPIPTGAAAGFAERREEADSDGPAVDGSRRPASGEARPVLEVRDVSVRYAGLVALRDVSITVREGEILGVIGPNGAGKTTLLNLLSGLTAGARVGGAVTLGGEDLRRMRSTHRRHAGLGRTFQHAELFSELTVVENVLCTSRRAGRRRRAETRELLDRVGVLGSADALPEDLPFGLRKRVDLARATAERPRLLLMDEPFGGLDPAERRQTREQIRRLNAAGATVVIIDHVLDDLFAVADRVVAFDFGTPLAEGPPSEVIREPAVRAAYLGEGGDAPTRRPVAVEGEELVSLDHVGFHYGGVTALDDVDLRLARGEVLGAVGSNGAGKSTLGRVIGGLAHPTSGSRSAAPVRCAVVPEGRALLRTLSVRENLEVAAYGVGLRGKQARARVEEMLRWLPERLHDRTHIAAGSLSGGEQQMLAMARGIVGRPDVLVLDEPALGLAPLLVDEVYRRIVELAADGVTVVLLEQLLARALNTCDRVLVLRDGHVVAQGNSEEVGFAERAERAYFGDASAELLDPALS